MENHCSSPLTQPLSNFLKLLQEGLIVLDPSGYIIEAYQAAGKHFGIPDHTDLIGKHFSELY